MSIHGRPLAVATGVKLANPELTVVAVDGDGDAYGIGGNHLIHTARRNMDITHIVQNNQVYALTKGQFSPTTDTGARTSTSPFGVIEAPIMPLALALAAGAAFVARGVAFDPKGTAGLMTEAIRHPGYALLDVLQPCVSFNKINTYAWYRQRVYKVSDDQREQPRFRRLLRRDEACARMGRQDSAGRDLLSHQGAVSFGTSRTGPRSSPSETS